MKKIIYLIILMFIFIPTAVFAEDKIEIKSVTLTEKSANTVIVSPATIADGKINVNLNFFDVDDSATYKVVIKNITGLELMLDGEKVVSNSDYIGYEFSYEDNNQIVKAGEEKTFYIKYFYKTEAPAELFRGAQFDASHETVVSLTDNFISVPNTIKSMGIMLYVLIIAILLIVIYCIFVIVNNKRIKASNFALIFALLLIPIVGNALTKIDIPLNTTVTIKQIKSNPCTFDGELVQGAEYVNGQYTYRYMQEFDGSWINMTNEGWGVILTNKDSTDSVTSKLCTTINDKPIVSMRNMFLNTKTTSIDLSSFDTSNVVNMEKMFLNATAVTSYDFSKFNTSKVTNMSDMFINNYAITSIDLSYFDMSKVTKINSMFNSCTSLENIIIDYWDLSSLDYANTGGVFSNTKLKKLSAKNWKIPSSFEGWLSRKWSAPNWLLEEVDVTGWDLSNTTNLNSLFADSSKLTTITGIDTWDTSNVTNFGFMLQNVSSIQSINLDNLDFSGVTSRNGIQFMLQNMGNLKTLSTKKWVLPAEADDLFNRLGGIGSVTTIDVTDWDTSKTTNLSNLFRYSAGSLQTITGLDSVDMSTITNIDSMFEGLSNLQEIKLFAINKEKITSISNLFQNVSNLKKVDLSNMDLSGLTSISGFFNNDWNIIEIKTPKTMMSGNLSIQLNYAFTDGTNDYNSLNASTPANTTLTKK